MIVEAFAGQNILITGATGFLGKVILEKLLRSIPDLGLVYLLIRPKKDKSAEQRLKQLISSRIFNRLRGERKDFEEYAWNRLRVINGDVAAENCGISEEDSRHIIENVNIFIHSAATIDFTAPLSDSINLNVLGSLRLFAMAKKCRRLVAFTHISTAYVSCNMRGTIEETLYPLDFDASDVLQEMLNTDPAELDKNEQKIMCGYPNTYTFTKSLTEHLLADKREGVPLVIFRPSIIGAAYKEPTPGWLDTVSAASALYVTAGMGIMKFMLARRPDRIGDQVPVDIVSNALIAATADIAMQNRLNVIHVGTSKNKPLTWEYVKKTIVPYLLRRPPKRTFSKPSFMFVTSDAVYNSLYFFQYRVPIAAYNLYARFLGDDEELRQAQLWASFEKRIRKMVGNFNYFVNHEWIFDTAHTYEVFNKMPPHEQEEFNFDIAKIDWEEYLLAFCYGMKLNILREEDTIYHLEDRNCPMYLRRDLGADFWWAWSGGQGVNEMYKVNPPEKLKSSVLSSQRVQDAIVAESETEGLPVNQIEARAREVIEMMAGTVNMGILRTQGYLFRKFYRYYYQGIFVDELGIRRVAEAAKRGPVILMPTHRSYLDFLLTSFVFYDHDLPVPRIASGDDFLNMFFVSWMFRQSGAFFMRRSFGSDNVYRSIFTEYVQQVVSLGHPLEFFIEGTRSRTGKTLPPKLGVLSMIVDAFLQGGTENISLCPITMNYERLIEEEAHGRELTGEKKEKPTTTALVKATASKLRHLNFGRVNVQFAEPISVEEYVAQFASAESHENPSFDPSNGGKDLWKVVESLGYEVVESFHREMVIMSTALVAALALVHRDGISVDLMADKIGWLREQIVLRGSRVDPIEGTNMEILEHCMPLLDTLLITKRNIIEPNFPAGKFGKIQQLSMYRNNILHVFQRECHVVVCMNALLKDGSSSVSLDALRELHTTLSAMFVSEFVDKKRDQMFMDTLQRMESYGLLKVEGERVSQVLTEYHHEDMWMFLGEMIYPFVDSYWVAAVTLLSMLGKPNGMIERMLVERMQWFAEKHYHKGAIRYCEAGSKEALRNAIKHFSRLGVVLVNESSSIELTADYKDNKDKLMVLVDRLAAIRRVPADPTTYPLLSRM
mmetsp:Transcript_7225/g.30754  ORF Transcript_7225/g.30754 Transcript_7225/m.30754 type:complete len:1117 (+) Transcript_7225:69-3419(+)